MQTTIDAGRSTDAARLALKLIQWNYGTLCKDVVQALLKHGRQTFQELRILSKLPPEALRTALVVLIQQNCVAVYLHTSDTDRKTEQLYEADMSRMLQIVRMPWFLEHTRSEFGGLQPFGDVAVAVVQTLLHHGRLQMWQLSQAVHSVRAVDGVDETVDPRTMQAAVQVLVNEHFVERVPPCTLPPPPLEMHINTQKNRKKAAPKPGSEEDLQQQREAMKQRQRMDFQAVRFEHRGCATLEAFRMPEEGAAVGGAGAGGSGAKRPAPGEAAGAAAGLKRIKGVKAEDGGGASGAASEVILWRVNYDEFNRRFRNQEVARFVSSQYGEMEGKAVEALLSAAAHKEGEAVKLSDSGPASVEEAVKESKRLHGDGALPPGVLRDALNSLAADSLEVVQRSGGTQFTVSLEGALGVVRAGCILAVVGLRFGETARRIWNMLLLEGQMEQKAVADQAMVPNAEAREALYAMLKDGYLRLQDIPRNNDRAPSRTFYTWRASVTTASSRISTQLYRSMGNVLQRLGEETTSPESTRLLEMVDEVAQGRMDASQLNVGKVTRLKAVLRTMETALLRMDQQAALFCDM